MAIPGLGRARRLAQRLHFRPRSGPLILLYHGVAEVTSDPWSLFVSPTNFSDHLEFLKRNYSVIPLQRLVENLENNNLSSHEVVITFDDGYANNFYQMKPLLEKYDVHATIFITTNPIGTNREFWNDELDHILLQSGTLPPTLTLTIKSKIYEWELGISADYNPSVSKYYRHWRAYNKKDKATQRQRLYCDIYNLLYPLTETERQRLITELLQWAGLPLHGRPSHRVLTAEELVALGQDNLIEIGAHTVSHPTLANLPLSLQAAEIRDSKAFLEELTSRPVKSFAYPFGGVKEYSLETVSLVRKAGFNCACSTLKQFVKPYIDPFQLPRIQIEDWCIEEFSRRVIW